jgi:HD-GYP domain-containing protein (c-di-GMP phosphodiesterase class II)
MSYFGEFDPEGRAREDLPSGWEEARKVTSILVDATTPKDHYTSDHALQVARLSWLVGVELGLSEEELEWLVHGALLLHDLGKIGVADAILEKLGPLTEEEWRVVKRHPDVGARMIEPLECLSGAIPVIRHHHERPDGSGYPDGLEGDEIPLGARIVAVVDAYDVMLRKPYRPESYGSKKSPAEALQELSREAGRQFDVRVVEAMGRLLGDPKTSSTDSPRTD